MTNDDSQLTQPTPWYVIHTKPRRELLVAGLLERYAELTIFLPEVRQPGARGAQLAPLFPGYLFVQVDLATSPAPILHTPGVIGLVGNERQPVAVAGEIIHSLQEQVATVNARGGLATHPFRPGDQVVIRSGPLQGLDAVFVGPMTPTQRVQVLLYFLGQQQQVEVDVRLLEKTNPAQPSPNAPRPRRTRGQGRRIHTRP